MNLLLKAIGTVTIFGTVFVAGRAYEKMYLEDKILESNPDMEKLTYRVGNTEHTRYSKWFYGTDDDGEA